MKSEGAISTGAIAARSALKKALRVYLCTDRALTLNRPLSQAIDEAIGGGITLLQLREKDASTGGFYGIACRVQEAARAAGIPLIVNDRLDIALAVGAEGLHIGQSDLPVAAARRICDEYTGATKKKRLWIGVSAGTVEEARSAERDGADYIGAGPIFPTGSKADAGDAIGLEGLKAITRSVHIPVVGIGGINADNTPQVMAAGSVGVAVISAILSAPDIRQAAAAIRAAVSKAVPKNAWRDALGGRGMIQ